MSFSVVSLHASHGGGGTDFEVRGKDLPVYCVRPPTQGDLYTVPHPASDFEKKWYSLL